jgi:YHS domain-containing protein
MKRINRRTLALTAFLAFLTVGLAAEKNSEKTKPYPLTTCVVSGEKLGEMGAPYVFTHKGQEIKLCCKNCLQDFNKDPAKFLKKIEETSKARK